MKASWPNRTVFFLSGIEMYILQECVCFWAVKFKKFHFRSFSLFIQNENKIHQSISVWCILFSFCLSTVHNRVTQNKVVFYYGNWESIFLREYAFCVCLFVFVVRGTDWRDIGIYGSIYACIKRQKHIKNLQITV